MKYLNKTKKLDFILKSIKKHSITAYEISHSTNLTETGVRRIINGETKRPHINSINGIYDYIIKTYHSYNANINEAHMDVVADENELLRNSLLEHKDEIKGNFSNLIETLVKKIIAKETGIKFEHINENILTIFRKQIDMDMELKKIQSELNENGNRKIN